MKDRNKAGQKSAAKYIWERLYVVYRAIFGMIFSTNERDRERAKEREWEWEMQQELEQQPSRGRAAKTKIKDINYA